MASALSQLSPDLVAMMARGVSVLVASRNARMEPSVTRAMGSVVDADAGTVTVYVSRAQSADLLADVEANRQVAVMFSQPSTHRSVQLKAADVRIRPAAEADRPALERYRDAVQGELTKVGYPPPYAGVILCWEIEDTVALTFEPAEVFDQTPGPKAGKPIAGGAA